MRLIFLGTPWFAVPSLDALLRAGHNVAAVVTQPDRPKGRGQHVVIPPVKQRALEHGLEVLQPERARHPEAIQAMRELAPEIMIVVGYGQILPQALIDVAPRGIVNVHASLLPRWRGAAPIQWAIARGDQESGVTTMQIDAGLDTGDMLLKAATPIGDEEDAVSLGGRLAVMGADLLVRTLKGIEAGTTRPERQESALATFAPILKKADGQIHWALPAESIHNLIRGMQPWPGAHTRLRGQALHIWSSRVAHRVESAEPGALRVNRDGVFAACGGGEWLKLREVQREGRKKMDAEQFARGQRLTDNERLGD